MKFEEAMEKACTEMHLDSHIRHVMHKSDLKTYAEKIAGMYGHQQTGDEFTIKNSFMFMKSMDFCFYEFGGKVQFSISGNVNPDEMEQVEKTIKMCTDLCKTVQQYMEE